MMHSISLILLLTFLSSVVGFFPTARFANTLAYPSSSSSSGASTELKAKLEDKSVFDSKLLPPLTEAELKQLFKEFNISSFDFDNDPEIQKWQPSKEFFEKFGFQNNTVKYERKVMDVKIDFYSEYKKPILPQYKTFIADLMGVVYVQLMDSRYRYDALQAFGICTQYYTIMKGYALQDEVS